MNSDRSIIRARPDASDLGVLRHSYAYTLTIEALHTMCCEPGDVRARLQKLDLEFFSLTPDKFPEAEGVRASFTELHRLATRLEPRSEHVGVVVATLEQSHHTELEQMAQLLWEIHQDFARYMQGDA